MISSKILFIALCLFMEASFAQHKGINFQAVIKKPDGSYPSVSGLNVTTQILDPVNNCVLREELHTGKNIANGYLNLNLGDANASTPSARNPAPVLSLTEVMDNKKTRSGLKCVDEYNNITSLGAYTPSNVDRRVLRVRMNIQGEDVVADFNMRAVGFAVNSEMLNSKTDADFINVNSVKGVSQNNLESIFERFTKLDALLNNFNAGGTSAGISISGNAATATSATNVTGTVAIDNGGTGATTPAGARTNLGLGTLATMSPTGTADITTYLRGDGTWQPISGGGAGTLASVGLSLPSIFEVTNSPLTADGTLSATLRSQDQSYVLAAPPGSSGAPAFRQLQVSDLSNAKSAALYDVPVTGDAGPTQVVKGDDSRLTNARTPIDSSVTTAKIANGAVTNDKIDSVAGSKVTGTVSGGVLPVASENTVGIVNTIAQSFKGLKTFIDNVILQGTLTVSGAISSSSLSTSGDISASGNISSSGEVSAASLKITGGSPAAGKVLTSDASGNADWQPLPVGKGLQDSVKTIVGIGDICSKVGELARTSAGELVVCEEGLETFTTTDCSSIGIGAFTMDINGGFYVCTE